jgi:hypothetical protein
MTKSTIFRKEPDIRRNLLSRSGSKTAGIFVGKGMIPI